MSAPAAITLKNNAGTNVTFDVWSVDSDNVTWSEAGATSILGTPKFKLGRKISPNQASGVYRVLGKLVYPVVNATTGALDGTITGNFEILRPAVLSNANADEAYARFKEAVALAIVKLAVETGAIPA